MYFIHNNPAAQHLRSGVVFYLYFFAALPVRVISCNNIWFTGLRPGIFSMRICAGKYANTISWNASNRIENLTAARYRKFKTNGEWYRIKKTAILRNSRVAVFFCREIRLLHIKPLNLSAVLCIKSLKYFNLCDKIAFIGIAHGDTWMRAAEASRRLVLFLLLRGVLKWRHQLYAFWRRYLFISSECS